MSAFIGDVYDVICSYDLDMFWYEPAVSIFTEYCKGLFVWHHITQSSGYLIVDINSGDKDFLFFFEVVLGGCHLIILMSDNFEFHIFYLFL